MGLGRLSFHGQDFKPIWSRGIVRLTVRVYCLFHGRVTVKRARDTTNCWSSFLMRSWGHAIDETVIVPWKARFWISKGVFVRPIDRCQISLLQAAIQIAPVCLLCLWYAAVPCHRTLQRRSVAGSTSSVHLFNGRQDVRLIRLCKPRVTAKAWINRRSNWNPHFLNPDEFYINFWGSFSPV